MKNKLQWMFRGVGLVAALLVTAIIVYAAGTAAGTQIKNQATALYQDANGNRQSSTSNEVVTVVLPVYGLTVTPNGTVGSPGQDQTATPSTTVYFPYLLTNTGNADDTYNLATVVDGSSTFTPLNMTIYEDTNGNGIVDGGESTVATTSTIGADETMHLIVAYDVPAAASAADRALVNLTATSVNDGSQTDIDNWNRTTVVVDAVLTVVKAASPANLDPGDTLTFTISGSNTGTSPTVARTFNIIDTNGDGSVDAGQTGQLLKDNLPTNTGITAVPGTDFGAFAPAGATTLYGYTNGNWSTDGNVAGWGGTANVDKVGLFISGTLANGQAYSFIWNAVVSASAPAGFITNQATFDWENGTGTIDDTPSNTTITEVNASYSVEIGQSGHSDGGTGGPDYTSGSYTVDITTASDTSIVSNGMAGTIVDYINTVRNLGTADDIVNMTTSWTVNAVTGASVTLLKSDGVTPLGDANSDGIPDVGPIAAGLMRNVVVRVYLPGTLTSDALAHDVTVVATSASNAMQTNSTIDRISSIVAAAMDITNNTASAESPYSQVGSPGATLVYPLTVTNNAPVGGAYDTYNLTQTQSLPANWTLEFFPDVNNDQQRDSGSAKIDATTSIAPQGIFRLVAVVTIPAGQAPVGDGSAVSVGDGQQLTFVATGLNSGASDSQIDWAEVSQVNDFTFAPDNAGTASPGGTVTYRHVIRNNGTISQNFSVALDPGYTPRTGWTYMISTDGTTYSASVTGITLAVSAEQQLWVRVFVPSNEVINISEAGVIRATNTTASTFKTRKDITTVVNANLQLTKSVNTASAQPGDDLTYTVNYSNLGSEQITNVFVYDAVPEYTGYDVGSASPAAQYSNDNGATWTYTPVSGGGSAPAGYDYNVTNIRWNIGNVAAGASSSVTFIVRIK